VTLNGPFTFTDGAAVSVDPVTAMLPVFPDSVHSGAPPSPGDVVGHEAVSENAEAVGSAAGELAAAAADDVLVAADDELAAVSASEPHAVSIMTSDAAPATNATEADALGEFTVATLQLTRPGR
jgi:hypothetical protein